MSIWTDIEGYPIAQVLCAFVPFGDHQIALKDGDYVVLLAECGDWYKGAVTTDLSTRGIFPKEYITVVSEGVSVLKSQPKIPTIPEECGDADDAPQAPGIPIRRGSAVLPPKPPLPSDRASTDDTNRPSGRSDSSRFTLDDRFSPAVNNRKSHSVKGVSTQPGVFRDEYGFAVNVSNLDAKEVNQKVTYAQAQRDLWRNLIAKGGGEDEFFAPSGLWSHRTTSPTSAFQRLLRNNGLQSQLTQAIRSGVPADLREKVWWLSSGAWKKQDEAQPVDQYNVLVDRSLHEPSGYTTDIEKDLYRTFPQNSNFESEEGVGAMRRVLSAYALRNPDVGYCQSMNFLTAILLLHTDEEKAFWILAAIIEDILPADYYSSTMLGCRVDQHVLTSYLAYCLPRVHEHFQSMGAMIDPITCHWFLCMFVNSFPLETTLRIWDAILYEGSEVLVRTAATIIKVHERNLLATTSYSTVYAILKTPLNISAEDLEAQSYRLETKINAGIFMRELYDKKWCRKLSNQGIDNLRTTYESRLEEELARSHSGEPSWQSDTVARHPNRALSVRARQVNSQEVADSLLVVQRQLADQYVFSGVEATTQVEEETDDETPLDTLHFQPAAEDTATSPKSLAQVAQSARTNQDVGRYTFRAAGDTHLGVKTHIFSLDDGPIPDYTPSVVTPTGRRAAQPAPQLKTRYAKSRSSLMSLVSGLSGSQAMDGLLTGMESRR